MNPAEKQGKSPLSQEESPEARIARLRRQILNALFEVEGLKNTEMELTLYDNEEKTFNRTRVRFGPNPRNESFNNNDVVFFNIPPKNLDDPNAPELHHATYLPLDRFISLPEIKPRIDALIGRCGADEKMEFELRKSFGLSK